ncbi:MAG: sigma 54-interacting transcriptional regulator [Sedimentisphaerales bacterium]|nr:sigma 54-interacting transcriptional regulator [Sedimentisphaerales bacterium]
MSRGRDIILDSIADGVFTVDCDWNITSFNRAAERITGVSREQAVGQKCFDVFHADVCQKACTLRESIESGKEIIDRRINILNSEGQQIPLSISTAVIRDEKGEAAGGAETFRDLSDIEMLRQEIQGRYTFADIISQNHEIRKIFDILPDIAVSESTVLIEGPSGSGKELFAKALHTLNTARKGQFVAVNCGALPDTLLESELFGYVKGAFTDARKDKPGRFARAEGGTIFLDEIGDIPPAMQVKLLRVLQEKEYEPLGAAATVKADVRVIAATNKNLMQLVSRGRFRDDLYYRLNIVKINIPPLSSRREDVPLLVDHFISRFNAKKSKQIRSMSAQAMAILMQHDFPGNIRELENIIEHAFILCRGSEIRPGHLPRELSAGMDITEQNENVEAKSIELTKRQAEVTMILNALQRHNGNRKETADELGINKTTLWRKMKKYGVSFVDKKLQ